MSRRTGRPRIRRRLVLAVLAPLLACQGSGTAVPAAQADVSTGQALMDLGDLIVQLREENAGLQGQIDSLREVVQRQDTLVRRLALQAGLPVPP